MRPALSFLSLVGPLLLATAGSAATNPSPPPLPLAEVHIGARGECLTVFRGSKVEPVPFEVRGILPNYLGPQRDLIVIRLLGADAEFSGVAQGMSGSPCLLAGKVMGALSYSLQTFNKEPIAGVTPIADMLALLDAPEMAPPPRQPLLPRALRPSPTAQHLAKGAALPVFVRDAKDWQALFAGQPSPLAEPRPDGATPLGAAMGVAGMPVARQRFWQPYLASHQLAISPGASATAAGDVANQSAAQTARGQRAMLRQRDPAPPIAFPTAFELGGSIAAVMVAGDVGMAGTGTVSWLDGAKVLAFGHPMFNLGPVSMPMASANIVQVLASLSLSRKLPITGPMLGELTLDRLPGIGGRVGPVPDMVPVRGTVETNRGKDPFAFAVSRDQFWTPRFLAMALDGALSGRAEQGEQGTLRLTTKLTVDDEAPLVETNVVAGERASGLPLSAMLPMISSFANVWASDVEPMPKQASLEVSASFVETPLAEEVLALRLGQAVARPGERVAVTVSLGQVRAPPETLRLEVVVPPVRPGGSLVLVACDAARADALEQSVLGASPATQLPLTRHAQLEALRRRRQPGHLYVLWVQEQGQTQGLPGQRFANLPPSSQSLLGPHAAEQVRTGALLGMGHQVARPGAVSGEQRATLRIEPRVGVVRAAELSAAMGR